MRTLFLTTASILLVSGLASQASTMNQFASNSVLESSSVLELGNVHATADGEVLVYITHGSEAGRLIGTEPVRAGINPDVRVRVNTPPRGDVVAVLQINGQPAATREFDVIRDSQPR